MNELSVVVPCFNEIDTIIELLEKVLGQPSVGQVVVVDDGSTDGSVARLQNFSYPKL